jgi:hypothetical protein
MEWYSTLGKEGPTWSPYVKGTHSSRRLIRGSYFVLEKKKKKIVS